MAAFEAAFGNTKAPPGLVAVGTFDRICLLSAAVASRTSDPAGRGPLLVGHADSIGRGSDPAMVPQIERTAISKLEVFGQERLTR